MSSNSLYCIYALKDPRDDEIHYVGRTIDRNARMSQHLSANGNTLKDDWIRELLDAGLEPEMVILEDDLTYSAMLTSERKWISEGLEKGWPLTNQTSSSCSYDDFQDWLTEQIQQRGWNCSELARRCGISHGRVSQVMSGDNPGHSFLTSIADGLSVSPQEVFRRAGILPPLPAEGTTAHKLIELIQVLDEADQSTLHEVAQALAARALLAEAQR